MVQAARIDTPLRIVSLIPSATEIVTALGWGDALVGRSHECDYPASVETLPVCTLPRFNPKGSSREIHDRVTELLHSALSVYDIKTEVLKALQPTHIITQAQCEVCAVSLEDVERAVANLTGTHPKVISLQPKVLADVWDDLRHVAIAIDPDRGKLRAQQVINQLQQRLQRCSQQIQTRMPQQTVACIEWTDPLMMAGNWVPELVTLAGGHPLFAKVGQPSAWLNWSDLVAADPDLLIVMACGYDLAQARQAVAQLEQHPQWEKPWSQLQAVQTCRIYLTDGNQYFNRPGPRLVDSLEILAEILHPDDCQYGYAMKAWKLY
ncbi:MAG: cobalamin-binding protein [Cyanobacteria bacterium P01_A01_bin.114]